MEDFREQERRQFKRVKLSEPVHYQLKDTGHFGGCLSSDLSESGIRLRINEFVALNSEMKLQIQLPQSHKIIDCAGKVIWVEKSRFMDNYTVGLEFFQNDQVQELKREVQRIG